MADELDEHLLRDFSEAERCLNEGRLRECTKRLRALQGLVETAGGPPRWLTAFLLLQGRLACAAGRIDTAETSFTQALGLAERHLDAKHPLIGHLLANLAPFHAGRQRWSEAEQVANRAVVSLSNAPLAYWHDLSTALLALAECRIAGCRWGEAETVIRQALELTERVAGADSPCVRVPLRYLGNLQCCREEFQQAEATFRRVLRLHKQVKPADVPGTIQTYCDLASVYRAQGPKNNMARAALRAFRLARRARHSHLLATTNALTWLAAVLCERGQPRRAERVARYAVKIVEKGVGPEDLSVASRLHELGQAQFAQERYSAAEQSFRRALAIGQRACGPHWPDNAVCLNNLGILAQHAGRLEEAEQFFRQALASREEIEGPTHPLTIASRQRLERLLHHLGRAQEAEGLICQPPPEPVASPVRPAPEASQAELSVKLDEQMVEGRSAFKEKDWRRAEQHFRAAVASAGQLDTLDCRLGMGLCWLAMARAWQGDLEEGERLARRALVVMDQAAPGNADIAFPLECLGRVLLETGRDTEAAALLHRAFILIEQRIGPNDPRLLVRVSKLATVLERLGRVDEAETYRCRERTIRSQAMSFP